MIPSEQTALIYALVLVQQSVGADEKHITDPIVEKGARQN